MTQNILIEFTSDTKGVTTAEEAVQGLDKTVSDQFTKTNAALKQTDEQWRIVATGVNRYVDSVKNAQKAAAGAFGDKALKDYDNTLKKVSQSIETLRAKALVKQELLVKETDITKIVKYNKEIDALTKEIQQLTNAGKKGFDEMGNPIEDSETKVVSLRSRLKELKQELAVIDDPNDPKFRAMSIEAAELQDRISDVSQQLNLLSSDTKNLDAGIQAIQGIAGAFAAAQGALALFGAEEGEVQQTLLKVNAAMSIMQGIQQVGALLDKNSALNIFLIKTLRLQQATSTTAVAVAEGEAAVATEALAAADTEAAVAQQGLNAAMAANPAGVLILSLGVIVGLLEIFIGDTKAAAKAQTQLNNSFEEGIKINDGFIDAIKTSRDKNKAELEKSNASAATIRQNDILSLQEQLKQTKAFEDSKVQAYIDADNKLRSISGGNSSFNKDEVEQLQKTKEAFEGLQRQRFALEDQLQISQISNEAEGFKERLKNHTAFVEAQVLQTREGSRAELVAQIAAIKAKEQEQLQSEAHLPGEIAQIRAQSERDVQKVRDQLRVFDLNQEKLYADAKLQQSKEGSQGELNAKLNLLRIESSIEIAQAQGNSAKILDIKAKEKRDEFELIKSYNEKIADNEINARIASANSSISSLTASGADATSFDLLNAKKRLIDAQIVAEKLGVERSIDTEINKQARIKAIDAKAVVDKTELEKQRVAAEISSDENYFSAYYTLQINRAQRVLNNDLSSYSERKRASKEFYDHSLDNINSQLAFEKDKLEQHLITQKEFDTKELQLLDEKEALKTQKIKDAETERQQIQDKSWNLVSTLANGYFSLLQDQYSNDLAQVQDLESKKLITQAEADKRNREIKRKQAVAEKENALFNIAIATAQNVIKDHLNPILIALDLAAGIAQAAFVAARPLPKFKTGKIKIDGPGTETSDSIIARLSKNESVINAAATSKYQPALEAINNMKFEEYLANLPQMKQFDYPTMGPLPKWADSSHSSVSIDYDKLGRSVAKHVGRIEDLPSYEWNVDNDGLSQSVIRRNKRTTFLNKKFKYKG